MSHELELVDGRALVLTREPAWHRLGRVTGADFGEAEISQYAPEILSPVKKVKPFIFVDDNNGWSRTAVELPRTSCVVRTLDSKIVGEGVGDDSYGLVQPQDAFEFGQELGEWGDYPLVSAGLIREGRQFFFTYSTGDAGFDGLEVQTHQTVVSSHDGSIPMMGLRSATIVVCANTLAMALNRGVDRITFRHTSLVEDRMADFIEARKGIEAHQGQVRDQIVALATLKVRAFEPLLDGILPSFDTSQGSKRVIANRAAAREAVRTLYKAPVVQDLGGTGLGFVQAVNTYENWIAPMRGRKGVAKDTLRAERQFDAMVKGFQPLTDKAVEVVLASA